MNVLTRPPSPWRQLQTELRDLAFLLDRQGSHAAAELAVSLAARIDELPSGELVPVDQPRSEKP